MPLKSVIRIPQAENPEHFALLNINQSRDDSLDLTLEGTDGDSPFVGNIKQSRLSKLLSKNSDVSSSEWENLLYLKLLQRGGSSHDTAMDNVEVVANVSDKQMRIIVRRNMSGIHKRIGEVVLNKDENYEIDTISWISTAVLRSKSVEQHAEELSRKLKSHEEAVEKLKVQLEDLQQAKISDETALLDKFCEVLNYKKIKIRDQQNLLATAKVDKAKAVQIQEVRASRVHHTPSGSRSRKRKPSQTDSTSASDFESMDIDRDRPEASEDDVARSSTPENTAPESGHEDSDDLAGGTSASLRDGSAVSEGATSPTGEFAVSTTMTDHNAPPPPRRDLPFARRGEAKPSAAVGRGVLPETGPGASTAEGEADDESSDDEL